MISLLKRKWYLLFVVYCFQAKSQIANYISNGGFEDHYNCNYLPYIAYSKSWRTIDSINGNVIYASNCYTNVPYNGFGFQKMKSKIQFVGIESVE